MREKLTRPPLDRMLRIHERLRRGDSPNARILADELETNDKTIRRDIHFMCDRYGLPIEYDRQRHGFYYTTPVDQFPVAAMTEAEMFALFVADKAIAQYHGTPFQQPLRMAFKKLIGQLDSTERYSLENLHLDLSFRPFAPEDSDLSNFRLLTRAVRERRALKFQYRNLGQPNSQLRHVHPWHLACIDMRTLRIKVVLDAPFSWKTVPSSIPKTYRSARTLAPPRKNGSVTC